MRADPKDYQRSVRRTESSWPVRLGLVVAVVGVLGIILNSVFPQALQQWATPGDPASSVRPAGQDPSISERPADPPSARSRRPIAPEPAATEVPAKRGDTAVLGQLAETCRYWTSQPTSPVAAAHRESACRDMVQYAQAHGLPVPAVGVSAARGSGATNTPVSGGANRVLVAVDEYGRFPLGSIAFRECRAREKNRLLEWCRRLESRLDHASGDSRERLLAQTSAVCLEARNYDIVR